MNRNDGEFAGHLLCVLELLHCVFDEFGGTLMNTNDYGDNGSR